MKVNRDLADAVMMVSFIILVLVGTTTFQNESTKLAIMSALGVVAAIMVALRALGARQKEKNNEVI